MVVIFFFFKQKTAYEIKECDWSSDVCSSDLCRSARPPEAGPRQRERVLNGQKGTHREIEAQAEVRCAATQPVSAVRTSARVPAEVRSLPDLFPGEVAPRRDSRCPQVELVGGCRQL